MPNAFLKKQYNVCNIHQCYIRRVMTEKNKACI